MCHRWSATGPWNKFVHMRTHVAPGNTVCRTKLYNALPIIKVISQHKDFINSILEYPEYPDQEVSHSFNEKITVVAFSKEHIKIVWLRTGFKGQNIKALWAKARNYSTAQGGWNATGYRGLLYPSKGPSYDWLPGCVQLIKSALLSRIS